MKFKKFSLFLLVALSLFLFSGCGEEIDCSSQDSTYIKYKLNEDTDICEVAKEIPEDECGNEIPEEGETYCNCPKDVGKSHPKLGCFGSKGTYLNKSCDDFTKTCVLSQNNKVVKETKSLEFKNSDLVFNTRAEYNTPFILHTVENNEISLEISLLKFGSSSKNYKNIFVKELRIEDSKSNILATIDYDQQVTGVGSTLKPMSTALADTKEYDFTSTLKFKLVVSYEIEYLDSQGYVTKTVPKIETLSSSLSKFKIINPNFYEK